MNATTPPADVSGEHRQPEHGPHAQPPQEPDQPAGRVRHHLRGQHGEPEQLRRRRHLDARDHSSWATSAATFEYDLIAVPDPLTGGTRLIAGNISGVWTGVLGSNGQLLQNIGDVTNDTVASTSADVPIVTYTRNGNLQIAQFYYGAVQPNSAAAQVAGALLYAQSQVTGGAPYSAPDLLTSGNLAWDTTTPLLAASSEQISGNRGRVRDHRPHGFGDCLPVPEPRGGVNTNFFKVDGLGQTNGLSSANGPNPDPQWPNFGPLTGTAGTPFGQFAVNPVADQDILIGSETGLVYATSNQGDHLDARRVGGIVGLRRQLRAGSGLWCSPAQRSDRRQRHLLLCRHDQG